MDQSKATFFWTKRGTPNSTSCALMTESVPYNMPAGFFGQLTSPKGASSRLSTRATSSVGTASPWPEKCRIAKYGSRSCHLLSVGDLQERAVASAPGMMVEYISSMKTFVDTLNPNHHCQQPKFVSGGVGLPESVRKYRSKKSRTEPHQKQKSQIGTPRALMKDSTRAATPDPDANMMDAAATLAGLSQRSESCSSDECITTPSPTVFYTAESTPTPTPSPRSYCSTSTSPVIGWKHLSGGTGEELQQNVDPKGILHGQPCTMNQSEIPRAAFPCQGATCTVNSLLITTFQTRSRTETRALQDEALRNNRRYVPPARQILQYIHCRTTPPLNPQLVDDMSVYPIIRIGDTIELKFKPVTPFQSLCQGHEVAPHDQVALGFATRAGPSGEMRKLNFEILYHSFVDGTVCLRCQKQPVKCECKYANDLLEINRDWKAKKDPARRLGLRPFDDGWVGIALRIPRTRRPVSDQERDNGCLASERPNTWNSKLKQLNPKDAKVVLLRVTEYSECAESNGQRQVISTAVAYARLIAKNGGHAHTNNRSNRKRKPLDELSA
eukprot:m.398030 g.398030  ORF g.398030 m.398030 type:complete len:554 (-) comp21133_c0_seq1:22-1683(-)